MFRSWKRALKLPTVETPIEYVEMCDICGDVSRKGFRRCARHVGVVFNKPTGENETRGGAA